MRIFLYISILGLFAATAAPLHAQAGRIPSGGPGKNNQRSQPSPTPHPTPVAVTATPEPDAAGLDDPEVIRVNTQLVSIPVRVMDKKGRFVGGLGRENFKVLEDGVEQDIEIFSNENEPFTVALVLDMSYSTTFKIAEIQSAAIAFIEQLRPQDRVMVVSFDQDVHMLCEATNDRQAIYRAIRSTKISTGTSLYEAVDLVMNDRLRRIDGRKAIILFTDGVDTTSRRSNDLRNLDDALELEALIYPIRYDTFADVQTMKAGTQPSVDIPLPGGVRVPVKIPIRTEPVASSQGTTAEEYQRAREYLDQMALRTGGRLYEASTIGNLSTAYSKIASELREFYSIGYYPKNERVPGKKTAIKVRVDREGLAVRTREGYITPKKTKISTR
jgi:Ca-activated chloride channel homolog